jgi:hypothetical protein
MCLPLKEESMSKAELLSKNIRRLVYENGYTFTRGTPSISGRQLYRIEVGSVSPRLQTLESIADDLGIDFNDFFEE